MPNSFERKIESRNLRLKGSCGLGRILDTRDICVDLVTGRDDRAKRGEETAHGDGLHLQ